MKNVKDALESRPWKNHMRELENLHDRIKTEKNTYINK